MDSRVKPLPPGQRRVLEAVATYWQEHGYAPSVRDVAARCGFASKNAARQSLQELRSKGYVEWDEGIARSLRIVSEAVA